MGANCSCKDAQGTPVEVVDAKPPGTVAQDEVRPPVVIPPSSTEPKTLLETPVASPRKAESPAVEEPQPQPPRLTIEVVGARGLRNADWLPGTGKSDCYCIVKVVGNEQVLHRTKVINDTLEPVWKEEADITLRAANDSLEFCVWDKDAFSSNFLGKVVLESSKFEGGFNGELLLQDAGKAITAYLRVKVKMAGQEYPPGPPMEFSVQADKVKGKPLGLDLDIQDNCSAYVVAIREGPFQTFNQSSEPNKQLRAGDFILKVNGVTGKGSKLLDQMKQDSHLDLLVRRPQEITAALERSDHGKKLGIEVTNHPIGKSLLITKISAGLVREWNEKNGSQELKAGDRVVAVGGQRGSAQELKKCLEAPKICHITVARPTSSATSD